GKGGLYGNAQPRRVDRELEAPFETHEPDTSGAVRKRKPHDGALRRVVCGEPGPASGPRKDVAHQPKHSAKEQRDREREQDDEQRVHGSRVPRCRLLGSGGAPVADESSPSGTSPPARLRARDLASSEGARASRVPPRSCWTSRTERRHPRGKYVVARFSPLVLICLAASSFFAGSVSSLVAVLSPCAICSMRCPGFLAM